MTVAIVLIKGNPLDTPLSKPDYFRSHLELCQVIEKHGGEAIIVRGPHQYLGNREFAEGWKFEGEKLISVGRFMADVVYDKGRFVGDGNIPVLTNPAVAEICTDKWLMYQKMPDLCPPTWLVKTQAEFQNALAQIKTQKAVIKPQDGMEGYGIIIDTVANLMNHEIQDTVLVQEFLDSSQGIPGIVDGIHDFRIAVVEGEIVYSYVRTPPPGKLVANVSQGGQFKVIPLSDIPTAFITLVKNIDVQLQQYPLRFYGVDLCLTPDGPKIIEMNSRLGLLPNSDHQVFVDLKEKLAQILLGTQR